ncbi:copper resistance D family protein [Pelagibius marinus]|uniref:copper resistance D family protein n=1 Tax=Pelagibius marinus TaxID=2762760 RepID=UPI001872C841|nr:CopD family protein [Pelagibius marinus]
MVELSLSPVEAVNLGAKVLAYGAALAAVGALSFIDTFRGQLAGPEIAGVKRHLLLLVGLTLLASLGTLYVTVALLNGLGLAGGFDPELWTLVAGTAAGEAVWVRFGGMAVLLLGLLFGPLRLAAAVLGGLIVAASFGFVGHVQDDLHSVLLHGLLMLHLLAVAYWIGSLWPLLRLATAPEPQRVAQVMERFGRLAVYVVTCLLAAGVVLAALLLDGLLPLFTTPYGRLLLAKLLLVGLLLCFAALNKWRLVPALAAGAPDAGRRLQRSIAVEAGLVVLILGATGLLTSAFSPA